MKYVEVILRYRPNLVSLEKSLKVLGARVNPEPDQIEGHIERCNGPELQLANGDIVISVLMSQESADKVRGVVPNGMLVDWINGEQEEVVDTDTGEVILQDIERPVYEITVSTEDNSDLMTQGPGKFMI